MIEADTKLVERFWTKVEKRGPDECWEWKAGKGNGYGSIRATGHGPSLLAHRISYELLVGPIPEGLVIDHLCRNRGCVNPTHLEPVTMVENVMRGESPYARAARQTECIHGHPFTPENTYVTKRGGRHCLECCRRRTYAYGMQRVPCIICGKELLRGNMHRHIRKMHPEGNHHD